MAFHNVSGSPMTQDNQETVETFDIVKAAIIITIAILVNITNLLTLLVVRSYKFVFNPNVLIGGIALVHYVASLTLCPVIAYSYLIFDPLPLLVCDIFDASWTFYQLLSTSIVTLMVFDRYIAIRKPILYRTRFSGSFIKFFMLCALLVSIPLSFAPVVVKIFENKKEKREVSRSYCIGLHNQYYQSHVILVLAINAILLIVGLFCYVSFLLGVRNFVSRWLVRFSSQNSSTTEPSDVAPSSCLCCCVKEQPQKYLSKEELVERTLHLMKNLHIKRCTRISKTIAVAAGVYCIPWLLSQGSILYEVVTGDFIPLLDDVIIQLVLASSILNPFVYVTFSKTYRYGYQRILTKPLHSCGYEWRSRKPLGLSGSEMQRISHRMALEEWESPGLVRRQYSKRRSKKRRIHQVYTISQETKDTELTEGTRKHNRYRKNWSKATSASTTGVAAVSGVRYRRNGHQENVVNTNTTLMNGEHIQASIQEGLTCQGNGVHGNVNVIVSENEKGTVRQKDARLGNGSLVNAGLTKVNSHKELVREEDVRVGNGVPAKTEVMDIDLKEGLVQQSNENDGNISLLKGKNGLVLVDQIDDLNPVTCSAPNERESDAFSARGTSQERTLEKCFMMPCKGEMHSPWCMDSSQSTNDYPESKPLGSPYATTRRCPQTLRKLAASAVESARHPTGNLNRTDSEISPKSSGGNGPIISSASKVPGLEPFKILAAKDEDGQVCIHIDVIELVNSRDMTHNNASVVSTLRNCHLVTKTPKTVHGVEFAPSFIFSLRENRFIPDPIDQEWVYKYAYQCGNQPSTSEYIHKTTHPIMPKSLPNLAISQDHSRDLTTAERPKRTSETLRESSRYSDDIVMLNDLMLKDRTRDKSNTPVTLEAE